MNIAFFSMGGNIWYGGISHLKDLIYALRYTYEDKIKIYLICRAQSQAPPELQSIIDGVIKIPALRRWTPFWAINKLANILFSGLNLHEYIILRRHEIDVVIGSLISYKYNKIPTLSWSCDFQHVHFPEMFDQEECLERDRAFYKSAEISSRIIVMSESMKEDFKKCLPQFAGKVKVFPTAAYIPGLIYKTDPINIVNIYNLPEKFIYMPNQFWKHKNHEIAFKAIKILKDKGILVSLVCTGYPGDYRHLVYFADLFQKLSIWNIKCQVTYLGMVPYEHIFMLMRQSISVLNPSLFEGFGLTVAEAKSLGKQVLLSDIPPFHEQAHPKSIYFDPKDAEDLAQKIAKIWQETSPGPDLKLEESARKELPEQMRKSAHAIMSVIEDLRRARKDA